MVCTGACCSTLSGHIGSKRHFLWLQGPMSLGLIRAMQHTWKQLPPHLMSRWQLRKWHRSFRVRGTEGVRTSIAEHRDCEVGDDPIMGLTQFMTCFPIREYNILDKREVHGSLQVDQRSRPLIFQQYQSRSKGLLRGADACSGVLGPVDRGATSPHDL